VSAFPSFAEFFAALWGHEPFPWQRRLAARVVERGWPELLDIPTGCGKTAALDVAVWHLAREAASCPRRAAVRVVYVVDRRLVVDQAFTRARTISRRLREAGEGPLAAVAAALRGLADGGPPLAVVRLRGGMPLDPDWVRTPHQPTVVLATVDQVGSRLLFRGYGLSPSMWPVHAGLFANDVLHLVDEAHLSAAFLDTLEAVARLRRASEVGFDPPFVVCRLTATPGTKTDGALALDAEDRAHEALKRRLSARKPARLERIDSEDEAAAARAFVERALSFLEDGRRRIGVVVNRVSRARAIFERLSNAAREIADVRLAIGRSRPLERDELGRELEARLGPARGDGGRAVILVATQTVEVGADFDFDALVTEAAPIDALCQRFGRLNRRGESLEAPAVILARKADVTGKRLDPVYGGALRASWTWLWARARRDGRARVMDFGIEAFRTQEGAFTAERLTPRARAPVFLPVYAEVLARTSPPPAAEPDIGLFLHGLEAGPPDVRIVWRADLGEWDLDHPERVRELLSVAPPSSLEALELPLHVARAWLEGHLRDMADVEGAAQEGEDDGRREGRRVLRWRGPEDEATTVVGPEAIRPGDVLVVPASYGGCDRYGWNPKAREPVVDLAEAAIERQRRRLLLRLHPALAPSWIGEDDDLDGAGAWRIVRDELERLGDAEAPELVDALLAREALPTRLRERLERLAGLDPRILHRYGPEFPAGCVLGGFRRLPSPEDDEDALSGEAVGESDRSSLLAPKPVNLSDHLLRVARKAERFARTLGLAPELAKAVVTAARLHDLGKAEPRFQAYLRGGDRLAARLQAPLAKSDRFSNPRRARELAGLPAGIRHEAWSVAAAATLLEGEDEPVRDLVLWLVGTHHGRGRPFFPPVEDPEARDFTVEACGREVEVPGDPGLARLDSFWFDLHARLHRRFGPWMLAYLEAILRLADHRTSEEEAG